MKRKTRSLLDRAKESLVLGVELFNRPTDAARAPGVLLMFDHSFEMLLKAVIFEKTGRIHSPREKKNYSFEKCLNVCQSQLSFINEDEALILANLNGFRDAAMHDLLDLSEGLLYGHTQSAVQIFAAVLKKAFSQDLSKTLPRRVLPLSTVAPTDINTVVSQDMESVKALLGAKRRREDEAEAKLRPYLVIETNVRKRQNIPGTPTPVSKVMKTLKKGDWKTVMPMVAGLVQSSATGIPVSIHVTKREGFPVRIDPASATAIAFRYVKPEDKYPYLTTDLAVKLKLTVSRVVGLVNLFQMKENDEFHTSIRVSKTGKVQRYSEKARQVLKQAIDRDGLDNLWEQVRKGQHLDPANYADLEPVAVAAAAAQAS